MPLRYPAERILIRCPNWIGDMVAATASVRCMRANYPDAHITLLLEPYTHGVIEHAPWFDEVIPFHKRRSRLREIVRIAGILRQRPRYDLALLMTHAFSTGLIAWMGGAGRRVGHAREIRSWLLTDPVPWPATGRDARLVPKVKVYASLLEYLGCEGAQDQRPEVFTSPQEDAESLQLLNANGREPERPLLALIPGAAYGSAKLWPPDRFARTADELAERHDMQTVILTGPSETAIGEAIAEGMRSRPIRFPRGAVRMGHLKAVIRECAAMLCNDTGPRHIGIACGLPIVTLMGPTHPAVTASDYDRETVVRQDVPCGPCYRRVCPRNHICMTRITPDRVVKAMDTLWARFGRKEWEDTRCQPSH